MQHFDPNVYPNLAKLDAKVAELLKTKEAKSWDTERLEYEICKIHPVYWMEEYGYIKSGLLEGGVEDVGIVPFVLNTVQLQISDSICECFLHTPWKRVQKIILKHRKAGISTLIAAYDYWLMRFVGNLNAFLIADLLSHTDNIASMIALFHERDVCGAGSEFEFCHPLQRVSMPGSKKGYKLNNGSMLELDTGENSNPGTSGTVIVAHMSENAKWHDPINSETSLLNSVPRTGFAFVIKESTAFGLNKFSEDCELAEKGMSSWDFIFLTWKDDITCRIPLGIGEVLEYTEEEKELRTAYGLDDEQLKWRRDKIGQLNSDQRFKQDFPLNSREPFHITGSNYFDLAKVQERIDEIRFYRDWKSRGWDYVTKKYCDVVQRLSFHPRGLREALTIIELHNTLCEDVMLSVNKSGITWTVSKGKGRKQGAMTMYKNPVRGHSYVVGVDAAEGLKTSEYTSDNSMIVVFDGHRKEQVAEWGGTFDEEMTAVYAVIIARFYNNAIIVPEMNNRCGGNLEANLKASGYSNIYMEQKISGQKVNREFGWRTTRGNKSTICGQLRQDFKNDVCVIHSIPLLEEMLYFIDDKGKLGASRNHTDDIIMATAIVLKYICDTPSYRLDPQRKATKATIPGSDLFIKANEIRKRKRDSALARYM